MAKRISAAAVVALKEALSTVYWYKSDLRSFLQGCIADRSVIAALDWSTYKRQIVSDLVDALVADQDRHLASLTKLCLEVTRMDRFPHLEQLEGGQEKARRANVAVDELRHLVQTHEDVTQEEQALAERQKTFQEQLKRNAAVRQKLDEIKTKFMTVATGADPQRRGYELEAVMLDLFELFDLDPKASFRNTGEQIDGAFSLEGTDYLFEAKWQQELVSTQELDGFASKVRRKLDNTLGLFLSMNGFSQDGVAAHSSGRPSIILMDGADLLAVLEERIDFVSLLLRKKRHAAQTGSILLPIHQVLGRSPAG